MLLTGLTKVVEVHVFNTECFCGLRKHPRDTVLVHREDPIRLARLTGNDYSRIKPHRSEQGTRWLLPILSLGCFLSRMVIMRLSDS
jgi:hypothetical protein